MRMVWWIARRELVTYFVSPLAYLIISVFILIVALSFFISLVSFANAALVYGNNPYYLQQLNVNDQVVRPLFGGFVPIFLLILFPAITMRLLPEEKRQGTAELILTSPITSTQIVLGKYLGTLVVWMVMLGASLSFMGILSYVSDPDWKTIASLYLGVFLLGASFLAVGLCLSAFTENQVLAYVLGVGTLLTLWLLAGAPNLIRWLFSTVPKAGSVFENLGDRLGEFVANLSVIEHFGDFSKGVIDTQHVVYYLSLIFFALFVAQRVVDSHRWR